MNKIMIILFSFVLICCAGYEFYAQSVEAYSGSGDETFLPVVEQFYRVAMYGIIIGLTGAGLAAYFNWTVMREDIEHRKKMSDELLKILSK